MISSLALKAARTVMIKHPNGRVDVDIKRYARVEKIPGGEMSRPRPATRPIVTPLILAGVRLAGGES